MLPFAEIAARDLDIAIVSQLPATHLALGDKLKPGPTQVVRFKAALRCWALVSRP